MEKIDLECLRNILNELIDNGYDTSNINFDVNVTLNFDGKECDEKEDVEENKEEEVTSFADTIVHPLARKVYLQLQEDLPYLVDTEKGFVYNCNRLGIVFSMGVIKLIFGTQINNIIYFDIEFPNEFKVPFNALFDNVLDNGVEVPMPLIVDFVKSGVLNKNNLFTPFTMYYISDVILGTKDNMKVMNFSYVEQHLKQATMFLKNKNQFRDITNKVAKIIGSLKSIITPKETLSESRLDLFDIDIDKETKRTIFHYAIHLDK